MAAHGDDWLITYADTITLLLCLFVVLLSISVGKRNSDHRPPSPVLLVQGNARLLDFADNGEPVADNAADQASAENDSAPAQGHAVRFVYAAPPPVASPVAPSAAPLAAQPVSTQSAPHAEAASARPEPATKEAASAKAPLLPAPSPLAAPPKPAASQGQRVYSAQISSAAFFGPGSATLSASGAELLRDVAATVSSPRLADYKITVEGHTDDSPIRSSQFPSNWELSTARAAAVVHFLLNAGVPATRLRAAGYADTFPLVPNHDVNGQPIPENQARNRRVVIRLEKVE
jgi:chemotaxis protein MotB